MKNEYTANILLIQGVELNRQLMNERPALDFTPAFTADKNDPATWDLADSDHPPKLEAVK